MNKLSMEEELALLPEMTATEGILLIVLKTVLDFPSGRWLAILPDQLEWFSKETITLETLCMNFDLEQKTILGTVAVRRRVYDDA